MPYARCTVTGRWCVYSLLLPDWDASCHAHGFHTASMAEYVAACDVQWLPCALIGSLLMQNVGDVLLGVEEPRQLQAQARNGAEASTSGACTLGHANYAGCSDGTAAPHLVVIAGAGGTRFGFLAASVHPFQNLFGRAFLSSRTGQQPTGIQPAGQDTKTSALANQLAVLLSEKVGPPPEPDPHAFFFRSKGASSYRLSAVRGRLPPSLTPLREHARLSRLQAQIEVSGQLNRVRDKMTSRVRCRSPRRTLVARLISSARLRVFFPTRLSQASHPPALK